MAKYSTGTDTTFIAKLTMIATLVEAPSIRAMNNGPRSLHNKSMRRICAFIVLRAASSFCATTTTCWVVSTKPIFANEAWWSLYPILLHRYQIHYGAELFEAGQECKK